MLILLFAPVTKDVEKKVIIIYYKIFYEHSETDSQVICALESMPIFHGILHLLI